jgi:ribonuclease III family protein
MSIDEGLQFFAPAHPPHLMNPLALAYIGDALYDLFIRQYVLSQKSQRPNQLHLAATRYVSAKAQARSLRVWEELLTEEELDMMRRGRNAKAHAPPKNTDVQDYRRSTGFECLIGFLYYSKRYERLEQLLRLTVESNQEEGTSP